MATTILFLASLSLIMNLPLLSNAISHYNGPCKTLDDCDGQLICINGKGNEDLDVGTHIYVQNLALCPAVNASPQGGGPSECDEEYDYQPPCRNDIVDGSDAVWHALGLNIEVGVVDVTWSMA
ncbi:hypothetical protein Patl1_03858 [Pistacia atlantica]|uniref:Uncharacterized protein n=1 Tax=Pistacia atlantica TaxID=434234 RepID=A0ACC1BSS3_9ROSI|nr:hypothetical protein Patl1_03858 [Pistacia atlantica]